jgi:hypothetical protein
MIELLSDAEFLALTLTIRIVEDTERRERENRSLLNTLVWQGLFGDIQQAELSEALAVAVAMDEGVSDA